jgi:uncharacterized DUF497 family protein
MRFEWDERKNQINRAKHGFDFADAYLVFNMPMVVELDARENYGEDRYIGIGLLQGRVVVVVYTELSLAVDLIAERIRSLGVPAPATYSAYAKLTSIPETEGVPKATEMIKLLVEGQEAVIRTARSIFPIADAANDEPTADLLTQRMQVHEKTAWMLRSLLEE